MTDHKSCSRGSSWQNSVSGQGPGLFELRFPWNFKHLHFGDSLWGSGQLFI